MNVLDYSLSLGNLLRSVSEGKALIELEAKIKGKYDGNRAFVQYQQYVKQHSPQYHFYSWKLANEVFKNVLQDDSIKDRMIFVPTAKIVQSDNEIAELASIATDFGGLFDSILFTVLTGCEYDERIPASWGFKIKNAISNVQIAVQRTLFTKTIAVLYGNQETLIDNKSKQEYIQKRGSKNIQPFSREAYKIMSETTDLLESEKILFEKLFLLIEVVKVGIFNGFWGTVSDIHKDELLSTDEVFNTPLKEVTLSCRSELFDTFDNVWLYRIVLEDKHLFFWATEKQLKILQDIPELTMKGILYSEDDRGLFEKASS